MLLLTESKVGLAAFNLYSGTSHAFNRVHPIWTLWTSTNLDWDHQTLVNQADLDQIWLF